MDPSTGIRDAIRTHGLTLFSARGVDSVSVAEICRAAEVANGSFYNFYRDKDALISELLADAQQALAALLAKAQGGNTDAAADHRRDVTLIVEFAAQNIALFRLALTTHARPATQNSVLEAFAKQRAKEIARGISQGRFRKDLDPELAARAEVGLTAECLRWWVQNPRAMPKAQLIEQLTQMRLGLTNHTD
jgi:AcrR family transcriptional regulator